MNETLRKMWLDLAQQILAAVPGKISEDKDPEEAILWAECVETCFQNAEAFVDKASAEQ